MSDGDGIVIACRLTPKGGRDAIDGTAQGVLSFPGKLLKKLDSEKEMKGNEEMKGNLPLGQLAEAVRPLRRAVIQITESRFQPVR